LGASVAGTDVEISSGCNMLRATTDVAVVAGPATTGVLSAGGVIIRMGG
jgi:hypothetical protein